MADFIGMVGERQKLTLTTISYKRVHSGYGVTTLITFTDPEGRVVKWFKDGDWDVELGVTQDYEATIKEHRVFAGVPETRIIRAGPYFSPEEKKEKIKARKAAKKAYELAQRAADEAFDNLEDTDAESIAAYRRCVASADALFRDWKSI